MLVAGFGLGIAIVSVSIAILTGAREEETGMISGLNSTSHEIGGTLGIAIFSTIAAGAGILAGPQAASGISHAFIAAAILASLADSPATRMSARGGERSQAISPGSLVVFNPATRNPKNARQEDACGARCMRLFSKREAPFPGLLQ